MANPREKLIAFRVSKRENVTLLDNAAKLDMSVSEYVRWKLFGVKPLIKVEREIIE